jgi:hypothetical protein
MMNKLSVIAVEPAPALAVPEGQTKPSREFVVATRLGDDEALSGSGILEHCGSQDKTCARAAPA